jgi:diguanylate cyclase (GGDEF)-like protein
MPHNRKPRSIETRCRFPASAGIRAAIIALAALSGWASAVAAEKPLGTLQQIHALTNADAAQRLPVAFEATVTYYRSYEGTLFVQDRDAGIYVQPSIVYTLVPGDRVLIHGTMEPSFRPFVKGATITLLRHGAVPKAIPATFDELIRAERDCMFVSVRARVRAADLIYSSDVRSTVLQMVTGGGTIDAVVDSDDTSRLEGLLDADVEITGAVSGKFDGKMQQTGIEIHATSFDNLKILQRAGTGPLSLPVTPMDRILDSYHVQVLSQRIRVHGTITYSQPGSAIVLQDGAKSLWIQTRSIAPEQVGDLADVTGFPGLHDGFLTLTNGAIDDSHTRAPITPEPATWRRLATSKNVFDLVSIEGKVAGEVAEASQDEYVLVADGQMFSAIYRHPPVVAPGRIAPQPLKQIRLGSTIRVSGICMLDDSNPFNAQVPFTILMRSPDDVTVIAEPSWLNTSNLIRIVSLLLIVVLAAVFWAVTLNRKVRRQTAALSIGIEAQAELERRMAQLEQRRSIILEDINGSKPLAEILEAITALVSFRLDGAGCWCEITDGARLGHSPSAPETLRIVRESIPARTGAPLGALFAGFPPGSIADDAELAALGVGARLATLAIETRRLYTDLRHRSEFDLLTDIHNRFSLEKHVDALIEEAREKAGIFGLIYVDLDEFKQVNDIYGHRMGDLYLQEVASRMKHQLRGHDMLARLGGDEFAAVVSVVRSRAVVEEVSVRLERCFDEPFTVEGYTLHGSASVGLAIYPEDGATRDSLISASDAAMYVGKHTRRSAGNHPRESSGTEGLSTGLIPKDLA